MELKKKGKKKAKCTGKLTKMKSKTGIYIKGLRWAFFRQRIPKFSYTRKKLLTKKSCEQPKNDDRKINSYYKSEQTYHDNKEMEAVYPVQMSIYLGSTKRKDFSYLHFNNKPRFPETQQVFWPIILVSVAYSANPSSN